jgi:HK97 family phage portal protein
MGIFDRFRKVETRNLENPNAPVSANDFLSIMGWGSASSSSGVIVNIDTALGIPAVWAAVNFLAGTLAGLPLQVYRKTPEGRKKVTGGIADILHSAVNPQMSSFEYRKYTFEGIFTGGRAVTYIERRRNGTIANLYPLDPSQLSVEYSSELQKKVYIYNGNKSVRYNAEDVLDIPFMLKTNQLDSRSPIMSNKDAIGMAIAASQYGSKAFQSGGIPPAVLQGTFASGASAQRASEDVARATLKLAKEGRPIMALPMGHELKSIGLSPENMQLLELQRFSIEQIARIYSLPPVFLQDLTHGTFSNTEQQDLAFVKHTVKRWVEQTEQEMNLKFFGRNAKQYVEFNVDGLLRGDFKTRMEAYSTSIQNGIRTPNEVRETENLGSKPEGDNLMIQGATVPIASQPTTPKEE